MQAGRKAHSFPGTCPGLCEAAGERGQPSVMGIFDPSCYPYFPSSQFILLLYPNLYSSCSKQAQQVSFPQEGHPRPSATSVSITPNIRHLSQSIPFCRSSPPQRNTNLTFFTVSTCITSMQSQKLSHASTGILRIQALEQKTRRLKS